KHFMLKEVYEQPRAIRDTTLGRVGQETGRIFLDEMDISPKHFREFRQVKIIACGTSWHAALAGKFMIEKLARMPVEVDYGSEFRYRDPILGSDTLTVVISQSGETVLSHDPVLEELGRKLFRATDFLFLGRGIHFPMALEGALKLKEISYIHAEGYPAGEMKHGPNALIDETLPVVVLATHDPSQPESRLLYEKTLSNIQEVKAREGIVIAVVTEGDHEAAKLADHAIQVPASSELLLPILEIV